MPAPRTCMPLALAITLALVLKVTLLTIIHKVSFSAPQVTKMRMPTANVEQHLLGTARNTRATPSISPPAKVQP